MVITKYGLEASSFGLDIPILLMKDYSSEFNKITSYCSSKVDEFDKVSNNNFNNKIPQSRTPLRKIGISLENENTANKNECKKENCCNQCEEILCLAENGLMDEFLEKLTNFTYNN